MFQFDTDAVDFGVTPVENLFIREYLPSAKGDFVKVYLWGLYKSLHGKEDYTPADAAQDLEMSLSEVESALRYWERRALVTQISEDPPVYRWYSCLQKQQTGQLGLTPDNDYTDFAESVYALFGDRRKVRPAEIVQAWEWVQDIGLSPEVVLMLLSHCMSTMGPRFSFKRAESLAVTLREQKISTSEEAEMFFRSDLDIHQGASELIRILGFRGGRQPSEPELKLYRKWRREWGFTREAIRETANETPRTGNPNFAYIDTILDRIRSKSPSSEGVPLDTKAISLDREESRFIRELAEALDDPALTMSTARTLWSLWRKSFPHEVILLAARECSRSSHKTENLQKMLDAWQEKGLTTPEKAKDYLSHIHEQNALLLRLFEKAGLETRPTAADRSMLEKWQSMGLDESMLDYGFALGFHATGKKTAYIDKIFSDWIQNGVRDADDAKAFTESNRAQNTKNTGKTVTAQQYHQRSYTEAELEGPETDELLRQAAEAARRAAASSKEQEN